MTLLYSHAFPVEISKGATIDELKRKIHARRGYDRRGFSHIYLNLWKLSLSIDQLSKLRRHFDFKTDGVKLSPLYKLSLHR